MSSSTSRFTRMAVIFSLVAAVAIGWAGPAGAATLTWDQNGATAGQTDGAGVWLGTGQWWDGSANATWVSGSDADFGNGGVGGAVTLASPTAVGLLTMNSFTGTYTLGTAGQTITLNGSITKNAGGAAATIISPVTLGGAQSWTNNSTGLLTVGTGAVTNGGNLLTVDGSGNTTISSVIGGTGGITKAGAGMLTLTSNASTYSGQLSIENGTLYTTSINNNNVNGVLGNSALGVIMGASSQTGTLKILVDSGISSNKDFTLATGGTGEFWFSNLAGGPTNADRPLTLSGVISGSGNLVKSGFAPVSLSGNNNYSGTTTISGGPLRLSSANALPGGIGATGGTSALTINGVSTSGAVVELTAASGNFLRGLGTGIDQFQITGGISGFSANGAARQVIVNNDPSFELVWDSTYFNPSVLQFGYTPTGNNTLTLQNKIDLNGATRTIAVITNTATISGDIRTSGGTAGITKTGGGTLVLSGNNTYNGPITLSAGTLSVGSTANLGSGGDLVFDGGTLQITSGTAMSLGHAIVVNVGKVATFNVSGAGPLVIDAACSGLLGISAGTLRLDDSGSVSPIAMLNSGLLNVNRSGTVTQGTNFPSFIGGTGSVANIGSGTLALNAPNFYTGTTKADAGTITLSHNLAIQNSALDTSGAGSVVLDTGITAPTFGGLNGASGDLGTGGVLATGYTGVTALTVNPQSGVTFTYGGVISNGSGAMTLTKTGAGTQVLQGASTYTGATILSAGTLTLSGAAGALTATSGITFAGGNLQLTNTTNTEGAVNRLPDGAGITVAGNSKLTYTNTAGASNSYNEVLGGLTLTSGQLVVTNANATTTPATESLTFSNGTGLAGHTGNSSTVAFIGGTSLGTNAQNQVFITGQSATGAGAPIGAWATAGAGTTATDYAAYDGTYGIKPLVAAATTGDGTWNIAWANDATGNVNFANGTTGTTLTASRVLNTLRYSGGAATLALSTFNLTTQGILQGGTGLLTISNAAASGGSITTSGNPDNLLYITTGSAQGITINAPIIDNGANAVTLVKSGSNTLTLGAPSSGASNYSGGTILNDGTLSINSDARLGAAGTAITFNGNATLALTAAVTSTRPITVNNGAIAVFQQAVNGGYISTSGAITGNGGVTVNSSVVNQNFSFAFTSTGNNFTGPLTIGGSGRGLTVTMNSLADSSSPITFSAVGGGSGGEAFTLTYGSGAIAPLTLNSRQVILDNVSPAVINNANTTQAMTINTDIGFSGTGARGLTLSAVAGPTNVFAGRFTDNAGGALSLTKGGAGTWYLSGTNTYTGLTTVSAGTLVLSGNNAAATGGMTLNAGVTQFDSPASINGTLRNVTVNSGGAVVFGSSFGAGSISAALANRIVADSAGTIAADNQDATNFDFDAPGLAAAYLGAVGSVTYTGTLTPQGTTYRLGGGGGTLTMANTNALTGAGNSLVVRGNVTLAAANDYTGGTTPSAGTLLIGNDGALGSGTVTFNGGTISSDSTTARTMANAVAFTGNATLGNAANTGKLTFTSTADLGGATRTVTLASDAEFAGVVSGIGGGLTKAGTGTLTLSGSNTYSGQTYASGGTMVFQGAQALSPSSTVLLSEYSSNFKILDDGTGTINLGNTITTRSQQTSAGATYKIFVGNNSTANGGSNPSSTTTDSTIVLGKFSYATVTDNRANGLTLDVYGANDYRLQLGDVDLNVIQKGNQMFNPTTAPLTITGTVKQINGKAAGANTGCDTLVLKGTATGNLISGTIMDALDYTDLSNSNAKPLNVTKSDAGEWTLSGTNSYTGVTTVSGGVLVLNSAGALPGGIGATGGTSALTFNNGIIGLGAGDFNRPLAAAGTVTGVNFTGNGGWAAYGADRAVNLGGNPTPDPIAWVTPDTGFKAKTLILGASTATHMVDLQNPLDLGTATRTVQVDDGAAAVDGKLSGVISGTGGLTKTGAGTLVLSNAANSYTGVTTVNAGKLILENDAQLMFVIGATPGTSNMITGTGTLSLAGDFNFDLTAVPTDIPLDSEWRIVDVNTPAETQSTFSVISTLGAFTPDVGGDKWTRMIPFTSNAWEFTESTGILKVVVGLLPGDTNGDKVVDAADFINLKKNFNKPGAGAEQGNFTGTDGFVDWADLGILMSNMGTGGGAPATAPEPCSAMLLIFGAAALLRRRRKA